MLRRLQIVVCCWFLGFSAASQLPQEKELVTRLAQAQNDEARVTCLGDLAELYAVYKDNKRVDSILNKQMLLAELSQREDLILKTVSCNAINLIGTWSSKETFDHTIAFLRKALDYAKQHNNTNLETVIYLKLASLYRKRNLFDQALEQLALGFSLVDKKQDSLKVVLYTELGDTFLGKGDAVSAYKNYNNAYNLSYSIDNTPLQSATWHRFSDLYKSLGDTTLAKNALIESLRLNEKHQYAAGLLHDYIDLFRLTDEISFLNRALFLADSLQFKSQQLYCKRLMLSYFIVVERNTEKALAYLEKHPDLQQTFRNEGLPNYNVGAIYHYSGRYADAISHYLKDETAVLKTFDHAIHLSFFNEVADCYHKLNQTDKAIEYYEKAYAISRTTGMAAANSSLSANLSQLYAANGDFKKAFSFSQSHQSYQKELSALAKQREVTLLGLEREKRRYEIDLQAAADKDLRRRNLQYTGISLATAFLFIALLVLGMFPTSKMTIRMLNFFAFICFFEFIILLIDNWLHHATHGEPLKIWLAKIFIIAILLPLHHSLEHVAVKFLSSHKLEKFRQRISVRRLFHPSKKSIEKLGTTLEESTLI